MASSLKSAALVNDPAGRLAGRRQLLWNAVAITFLWCLIVGLGITSGTFQSELGAEDWDEPAHYVTGLLIHDYIAQGLPEAPLPFATRYYLHYPKIALGVWPPFFHVIEAGWMLVFSPSHISVFLLSASITMASVVILFRLLLEDVSPLIAVLIGAFYVLLADVQASSASIMVDGLIAALEFLAVLYLARYIERQQAWYAYAFGCVAALGALAKANALAMLIVPFIAIALTRKWQLLRRREVWLALLIVCVTAAPWNYFLWRVVSTTGALGSDVVAPLKRAGMTFKILASAVGILLPFTVIGLWQHIIRPFRSGRVTAVHGSAFALIIAVTLFVTVVPATGLPRRYLLPCLAPLLLFTAFGLEWAARRVSLPWWNLTWRRIVVAASTALLFFAFQFTLVRRPHTGFGPAADQLARHERAQVILVASDAAREGMAVAEIAMRDQRPRHYVLRASKVLAQSDWFGQGYRPLFETPEEVAGYLDSVPVDYVLVDRRPVRLPVHIEFLNKALHGGSQIWRQSPVDAGPLTLWERIHPVAHGKPNISVDMNTTLKGTLSVGEGKAR